MRQTKQRVISPLIAALLAVVMILPALLMLLPHPVVAVAEEEPLTGYTWADAYYQSEWVGSEIGGAAFGKWVASDGQYNGAMMWCAEYDKVTFDSETGVITFNETISPYLKYHPGQTAMYYSQEGASYCSFEVYYESGTYEKDGLDVPNFSGLTFRFNKSNTEIMFIFSIGTDGKFYVGESIQYTPTATVRGQMAEGWNTIEFICLPKDADGNVLEDSNGEQYYNDTNGDGKYTLSEGRNENWPVKSVDIYVRLTATDSMVESRAYTQEYLDHANSGWTKIENFPCNEQFYSVWGSAAYINPINGGKGSFSLRNAKAVKLGVDEEIYQYSYTGYPQLTQAVPVGSSNKDLTIPAAKKLDDPTADVSLWYNETLDKFAKPGATVTLESSMEFAVATGDHLSIGMLGATLDKVRSDLSTYTYAELQVTMDDIETAALAAGLDADHPYMVRKETIVGELQDRMDTIAYCCEQLISLSLIFADSDVPLDERVDAFLESADYISDVDTGYSDETATAHYNYERFLSNWAAVEDDYATYHTLLLQIEHEERGTDANRLYCEMFDAFNTVSLLFPTYEVDEDAVEGYLDNMTYLLAEFKALPTLDDMYEYLSDWLDEWHENRYIIYLSNRVAYPESLKAAVTYYNDCVYAFNLAMLNAATTAGALQDEGMKTTDDAARMLSSVKEQLDKAHADSANGN